MAANGAKVGAPQQGENNETTATNTDGDTRLFYRAFRRARFGGAVLFSAVMSSAAFADDGRTLLHSAARDGDIAKVQQLIDSGADINAKDNKGHTPLHLAAYLDKTKIALALVKAGASLDARTNDGETPLNIATHYHGEKSEIANALR